jgi:hypothetical protein
LGKPRWAVAGEDRAVVLKMGKAGPDGHAICFLGEFQYLGKSALA